MMWSAGTGRSEFRRLRADAVAAAIDAGHPADEIASRLGVKPADLAWIVRTDGESWTTRH